MNYTKLSIGICMGEFRSHQASLIAGIRDYVDRQDLPWSLQILPDRPSAADTLPGAGRSGEIHGLVAWASMRKEWLPLARRSGAPVVFLGAQRPERVPPGVCYLATDDEAVGSLAARHVYEAGYRNAAVVGDFGQAVRRRRCGAYLHRAAELGMTTCHLDVKIPPGGIDEELGEWLRHCPRPLALFGHQDRVAHWLRAVCHAHDLAVPGEVGLLGVDDIQAICEAREPMLSSVALPYRHMGRQAGLLLHRLLSSATGPATLATIRPLRVTARRSTQLDAPADPLARRLLRLLRGRLAEPLPVPELAARLGISPAALGRTARRALGSTPRDLRMRFRLEEAERLLAGTDDPIGAVARRCGFRSTVRFDIAFKRRHGCSPRAYRQRSR